MSSFLCRALSASFFLFLLVPGCGSDGPSGAISKGSDDANVVVVGSGGATVVGSVENHNLVPQSAFFGGSPNAAHSLFLAINSQAGYCSSLQNGVIEPNQVGLLIGLSQTGNTTDGTAMAEGTYPVAVSGKASGTNRSVGLFYAGNGACKQSLKKSYGIVTAGSVEVTAISSSRLAGTFSFHVGNDNITGQFDAAPCDNLVTSLAKQGNLKCQAP